MLLIITEELTEKHDSSLVKYIRSRVMVETRRLVDTVIDRKIERNL